MPRATYRPRRRLDQWEILGETWWWFVLVQVPLIASWAGYFSERKAERMRKARNLPRPTE
ncbi:hypothetical protein [Cryobacterium fucosi]|uniref:Uncharacterized protein n=1 Tax=Cryobacterium fucosi TaxID=1259157 RepID=A0A4R9BAF8_9MICO|nr:hypothetical protein [Cryobacterium fucosi]TFD79165.1 hypothetical protein E3T48_06215 [Cryobacterium fucosi]